MTQEKTPAVEILEQVLASGVLAPRHEEKIASYRRYAWYKTTLEKDGKDKAEAELAEYIREYRFADFAPSVEKVARGMLALVQADKASQFTYVIDVTKDTWYPHETWPSSSPMVVVFNPFDPISCCGQLAETQEFGFGGFLGIQAVTLHASIDFRMAQLGLVLPARALNSDDSVGNSFMVAIIEPDGTTKGQFRASRKNFDLLRYSLGLADPNWLIRKHSGNGNHELSDQFIGFPGAMNYLADALPRLGNYFVKLAEQQHSERER